MTQFRKLLLLTMLTGLLAAPGAWANVHFSIVGATSYSMNSISGVPASFTASTGSNFALGYGGAEVGFMLGQKAEFELGVIALQRKWTDTIGVTVVNTATVIQVPAVLRFWLAREFSLGVGGYGSVAASKITQDSGATGTYASYGFKPQDFGALASAEFAMPLGSSAALTLDAQYHLGLSNSISDPASTVTYKINEIVGLVGIRFGGMGK